MLTSKVYVLISILFLLTLHQHTVWTFSLGGLPFIDFTQYWNLAKSKLSSGVHDVGSFIYSVSNTTSTQIIKLTDKVFGGGKKQLKLDEVSCPYSVNRVNWLPYLET
jgi:hypothetical protein